MTYCIIIPTYNNAATVYDVVSRALGVCGDVIVVNDGSTDNTLEVLRPLEGRVELISYPCNRGKGYALRRGLALGRERGFDYAVTLDADGQHRPEEVPMLIAAVGDGWADGRGDRVLVVGSRWGDAGDAEGLPAGMPRGNSFANRFSNFWFTVQTWRRLPDTQTGFRAYPLRHLPCLGVITRRYESELELLVFSAWRGVRLVPVGVGVSYEEGRVSHFRPFWDFFRISVLNTVLCLLAVVYGYPRMVVEKMKGGGR